MSQSESEDLTIDQAEKTINLIEQKFGFPAFWYRSADRARQAIRRAEDNHVPNHEKADTFERELYLLRDHLCNFAKELFAGLIDLAKQSGIDGPCDWAEEQTRAGIARIQKGTLDLRWLRWPDEIAAKHDDDLTCWVVVACSCRPVITRYRTFDYPEGPGWLVRWHPASAMIFQEREAFGPEDTEAIIANIGKWLSAEIEKAFDRARFAAMKLVLPVAPQASETVHPQVSPYIPLHENVFRKTGDYWTVFYAGKTTCLSETQGFLYIAHLLAHPGTKFHVLELINAVKGATLDERAENYQKSTGEKMTADYFQGKEEGVPPEMPEVPGSPEEKDTKTWNLYKQRLESLEWELNEAEENNDPASIQRIKRERELLYDELRLKYVPKLAIDANKARINLQKLITRAVENIEKDHQELAEHLRAFIKTGFSCSYNPPETNSPNWQF